MVLAMMNQMVMFTLLIVIVRFTNVRTQDEIQQCSISCYKDAADLITTETTMSNIEKAQYKFYRD